MIHTRALDSVRSFVEEQKFAHMEILFGLRHILVEYIINFRDTNEWILQGERDRKKDGEILREKKGEEEKFCLPRVSMHIIGAGQWRGLNVGGGIFALVGCCCNPLSICRICFIHRAARHQGYGVRRQRKGRGRKVFFSIIFLSIESLLFF